MIERKLTRPSTEEEVIKLKGASKEDVDKAVQAARKAFEGEWSELAAVDRGAFLYKLADLIDRDRELIAAIDAFDNGKVRIRAPQSNCVADNVASLSALVSLAISTSRTMSSDTTLAPPTRSAARQLRHLPPSLHMFSKSLLASADRSSRGTSPS